MKKNKGFTLIDILIVVIFLGISAWLVAPYTFNKKSVAEKPSTTDVTSQKFVGTQLSPEASVALEVEKKIFFERLQADQIRLQELDSKIKTADAPDKKVYEFLSSQLQEVLAAEKSSMGIFNTRIVTRTADPPKK